MSLRRIARPSSSSLLNALVVAFLAIPIGATTLGCSGSASSSDSETETTSGGEGTEGSSSGEVTGPVGSESESMMPSTALIPVPLPGQPRHLLSAELQEVWRLAEEGSTIVRPEYEGELTNEAMTPWVQGEFMEWASRRGELSREAATIAGTIEPGSEEFGVAGALVGYSYEEFVIAFRGVPIPEDIASDPELLEVYLQSLTEASQPFAQQAAAAYGACARTLAPLGPESPWVEWADYCLRRAEDVNEVYGLD